jgi:hypothetical protein
VLLGHIDTHTFTRRFDPATNVFTLPIDKFGTIPMDMPKGEYQRELWLTFEDGGREPLLEYGFWDTIYVVDDRSDEVPYTPEQWVTPTPPPETSKLRIAFAGELEGVLSPLLDAFEDQQIDVNAWGGGESQIRERTFAEHAAGIYATDIIIASPDFRGQYVVYEAVESVHPVEIDVDGEWVLLVMKNAPNPEAAALFVEWVTGE